MFLFFFVALGRRDVVCCGGIEGRLAQLSCCLMRIDVVENDGNIGHALFFVVGVLYYFIIFSRGDGPNFHFV